MSETTYKIIAILVMALVTYLPRMIPLVFMKKQITNKYIKSILFYIPYAVITALTFPAIFYSTGSIWTALIGTGVALILSYFKVNLTIVAIVCVCVVFGFGYIL
jgi:branched-subunit amino acid transport protein